MKNILPTIIALIAIACGTTKHQQADALLGKIVERYEPVGLSVAVVKDGVVVYLGAFGEQSLEQGVKLDTNSVFRIASISKSFTATALMQLVERGLVGLSDDISGVVGYKVRNPRYPDTPITFAMLLSHTSSINDSQGYYQSYAIDILNPEKNSDYALAFNDYEPGKGYEYCNLNFNLTGCCVELISGERFDKFVKENICERIGMTTGFNINGVDSSRYATLYAREDSVWRAQLLPRAYRFDQEAEYVLGRSAVRFSPTGGMKTTPSDLAKFMVAHQKGDEKLLSKQSYQLMHTPRTADDEGNGYGFALVSTNKLIEGETMVGHTGSAYGLSSAMFFTADGKFGVVTMTNGCDDTKNDKSFVAISYDIINECYKLFGE